MMQQFSRTRNTAILRQAAPLMGIAAAAILPIFWSLVIALGTAAVCLHAASASRPMFGAIPLVRYLRVAGVIAGHCAYLGAMCFVWIALARVNSLDIGYVLFTLVLLLFSFSAWLMCAFFRGTGAVVACWGIFISIATALGLLNYRSLGTGF